MTQMLKATYDLSGCLEHAVGNHCELQQRYAVSPETEI